MESLKTKYSTYTHEPTRKEFQKILKKKRKSFANWLDEVMVEEIKKDKLSRTAVFFMLATLGALGYLYVQLSSEGGSIESFAGYELLVHPEYIQIEWPQ